MDTSGINTLRKNKLVLMSVHEKVDLILEDLSITKDGVRIYKPSSYLVDEQKDKQAYLRGVFMMCGSINDPKTSRYHAEFVISNLESANFPYVTSIGYKAFANCTSLQELSVPEVVTIQPEALQNVQNLTKLDFPNLVSIMGSSTIATVTSANKASYLNIPYVTSLSSYCFGDLNAVNSIYAPNLSNIYGSYAIYG
jgi:hypothetical protein